MLANIASATRIRLAALPPLALYVHIPWCLKKCPYCDFNSHAVRDPLPEAAYIDALISDLDQSLPNVWGRKCHSIFIGGGTPSLFAAASIDRLLAAVRARLPIAPDAEITLEANPGTFEAEKFRAYRAAGVNRLSIGIQSFNPRHLQALGRVHDARQAHAAVEIGLTEFANVNLDVMYALPGQTAAECAADVATALKFGPQHLSIYHLTLEPNTWFYRYPPALPDDDAAAAMQVEIEAQLDAGGYLNYETSAYCRPGLGSRHNLNYWRFGDYLGIGAGAHSKISFPDRILRQVRHKQPKAYLENAAIGTPVQEENLVAASDLPFEFMLNALRLCEGVPLVLFAERTGLSLAAIQAPLARAEALGLIERGHLVLKPSERGRRFLNDLVGLFLPS